MLTKEPHLVIFVKMIDRIPMPREGEQRRRGRPKEYTDRLIVKALVIMVIRRLYSAYSLFAFLEQQSELTKVLRLLLTPAHLGATAGRVACELAGSDCLFGSSSGASAQTLGAGWSGGGHRQHPHACQRGRLAQERS